MCDLVLTPFARSSNRRRALVALLGVVALLVGPGRQTASAQMDAGSLRVLMLDPSNAVVPGATVTLTNAATGTAQTATSDGEGYVSFTPLPRGTYRFVAALDGFQIGRASCRERVYVLV